MGSLCLGKAISIEFTVLKEFIQEMKNISHQYKGFVLLSMFIAMKSSALKKTSLLL